MTEDDIDVDDFPEFSFGKSQVAEYFDLKRIISNYPIPDKKKDIDKQSNIRWLLKNIKPEWEGSELALSILKKCDETDKASGGGASPIYQHRLMNHRIDEMSLERKYLRLGLEITTMAQVGEPIKVYKLKIPFTPEEWMDIMNTEGEFLPMCCAVISEIRNTLMGTLREGGFISCTDLQEVIQYLVEHNESCYVPEDDDPLNRLFKIWELVKDEAFLSCSSINVDPNELDDAFSIIYRSSANISISDLFSETKKANNHKLLRLVHFTRIYPAIKTIYDHIVKTPFEPQDCFAICDEKNELITMARTGLAIYPEAAQAQEIADILNEEEDRHREQNSQTKLDDAYNAIRYSKEENRNYRTIDYYTVRPARLSIEKGLELL